ncbi:hypothetical protein M758_7G011700 [Ceratodon purpureus]|nr:hypothetical protein M758_7G011700 [Ceratodon purpureus]
MAISVWHLSWLSSEVGMPAKCLAHVWSLRTVLLFGADSLMRTGNPISSIILPGAIYNQFIYRTFGCMFSDCIYRNLYFLQAICARK